MIMVEFSLFPGFVKYRKPHAVSNQNQFQLSMRSFPSPGVLCQRHCQHYNVIAFEITNEITMGTINLRIDDDLKARSFCGAGQIGSDPSDILRQTLSMWPLRAESVSPPW